MMIGHMVVLWHKFVIKMILIAMIQIMLTIRNYREKLEDFEV